MTAQKMPIGIDDFAKLRQGGYYFVDKTRFIREAAHSLGKTILITRPRRFGKTLNLSMLRYFFTLENAEENRKLFEGLEIAGTEEMAEQGTRPVVFLTLKGVQCPDYPLMMECLQELMRTLYRDFRYLLESPSLAEDDKGFFQRILDKCANRAELQTAMKHLLYCLTKYHGKKPVLLLDEYDAPILSAWEKGYYEECIGFMRGFLGSVLKTNDDLAFAVLTGVTRVSKESIFSGLNNLEVCSVLSSHYSDIFGFTQEEVNRLMAECGREDRLADLKKWYDGYRFGSSEIYNPWSVIQFVGNGCIFQPYWINSSGNSILHVLLEQVDEDRRQELEDLMKEIPVEATIDEGVTYGELRESTNALYMMMMTTGYLKAIEAHWDPSGMELPYCRLLIPNREIRMIYRKEILGWMATKSDSIQLRHMLRAMVSGDAKTFRGRLQKILSGIVSYHDAGRNPESFYHGLMLGFSVLMEESYRVESNRESGYGRFDIAFFPLQSGAPGVILELKTAKSEEELEALAKEALQQIEEKAYITELSRQGVKDVWKYGIAFHGKKVCLEGSL